MSGESPEVLFARMDERLKYVVAELEEARKSRKHQYDQMEELGKSLTSIDGRVGSVEQSLAKNAPNIEEFITIKHKVVGAGLAGKWTWSIGASLITLIFTSRTEIAKWFSN